MAPIVLNLCSAVALGVLLLNFSTAQVLIGFYVFLMTFYSWLLLSKPNSATRCTSLSLKWEPPASHGCKGTS